MSDILVVGSLAYDSIQTPLGRADRALGGSANYFSLAASLHAGVRVVGVVGQDYEAKDLELLKGRGVDLSGVDIVAGSTFHWEGEYQGDMNEAITKATHLNVFEKFKPQLPAAFRSTPYVFLANIDPELQIQVLDQCENPRFVAMDTMNFWITSKRKALEMVLGRVDAFLVNEGEAKMLTGASNAIAAAKALSQMGPKVVVIKRGEYGFMASIHGELFAFPAYPIERVVDPTGAGDSFAGGFFGYLAKEKQTTERGAVRRACFMGALTASFTVQDFSVRSLAKLTSKDLEVRRNDFLQIVNLG